MKFPEKAFYVKPYNIENGLFSLCEDEYYHATKVLRLGIGDTIVLIDGKSTGYFGVIDQLKKKTLSGTIKKVVSNLGENKNTICIFPGLFKKSRFEILLEKATELGVKEIHPIIMERSIVSSIDMDRCNKILISAAKQSRRSFFPILHEPKRLDILLEKNKNCNYHACHLEAKQNLSIQKSRHAHSFNIIIGPEGGFSDQELHLMEDSGVLFFNLGKRRLRSETAAIASIALFNEIAEIE